MLTASRGLMGRLLQRERNRLKMYHSIHPYGGGKTSIHTHSLLSFKRFNSNFAFSYRSLSCNDLASASLQDNMSVHSICHLNEKQLPRIISIEINISISLLIEYYVVIKSYKYPTKFLMICKFFISNQCYMCLQYRLTTYPRVKSCGIQV